MKVLTTILFLTAASISGVVGEDSKEDFENNARLLNRAILTLPAQYVGDVPLEARGDFMKLLCLDTGRVRLDYGNGFLHYFVDGAAVHDSPSASSPLWLKLLPREEGLDLCFIHMAKPLSTSEKSPRGQTFVLSCSKYGHWEDVTAKYLPKNISRAMHLRPRREGHVIGVAEYEQYSAYGKKHYKVGLQTSEMFWNGDGFETRETTPTKIPHLDLPLTPKRPNGEQSGADQPATAPKSKSQGKEKPKRESEGRSR